VLFMLFEPVAGEEVALAVANVVELIAEEAVLA
jgi:hypothetical protein